MLLEIDVLSGRFSINDRVPMTLPTEMREKSASYQELFGGDEIDALGIIGSDSFRRARRYTSTCDEKQMSDISRKINGKWYSHIPKAMAMPIRHLLLAGPDRLTLGSLTIKPNTSYTSNQKQ